MAGNGLLAQWYAHGVEGLLESGRGMLVGVMVLFGLFAIRVLGAGDVKLVGAVGTFVGNRIWDVLLCICFMTGVIAVCRMINIFSGNRKDPSARQEAAHVGSCFSGSYVECDGRCENWHIRYVCWIQIRHIKER